MIRRWLSLLAIPAMLCSAFLLPIANAGAVNGTCYFNTKAGPVGGTSGCNVPGYGVYGTNDVLTGRSVQGRGYAIPLSVNTKDEFVNFILGRFRSGNTHDKIGAAFLIQELRGSRAWPSTSEVNTWAARMKSNSDVVVRSQWDGSVGRTSWYDPGPRNTFYADHPNVGRQVINIYYKGKRMAQIEHDCGNMVAGTIKIPEWYLTPNTTVTQPASAVRSPSVARPGDTIKWNHTIHNDGPDSTDQRLDWSIEANYAYTLSGAKSGSSGAGRSRGSTLTITKIYQVVKSDIGKNLCQRVGVDPRDWALNSELKSAFKCVKIIEDYELDPTLSGSSGNIPAGTTLDPVVSTIEKIGDNTPKASWEFGRIIIAPGGNQSIAGEAGITDSPKNSTAYYDSSWTKLAEGKDKTFNLSSEVVNRYGPSTESTLPVGTKICWTLSIRPPTGANANQSRFAKPLCIIIVEPPQRPSVNVIGYDMRVAGKTSGTNFLDTASNKLYGSWSEYGLLSESKVTNFASAAGSNGGSADMSSWNDLTYANTITDTSVCSARDAGCYGVINYPDQMVQALKARCVYSNKNITINATSVKAGQSKFVCTSGTVTVNGNISYDDANTGNLADLPQFVIIAKDIIIDKSVSNVDAWLIASPQDQAEIGRISTCAQIKKGAEQFPAYSQLDLTAGDCNTPLRITGPVVTDQLYLYRTKPVDNRGAYAEQFDLRADAFLWAYAGGLSGGNPVAQTTSVTELPPRY